MQDIAGELKNGRLTSPRFELVCLISYEENQSLDEARNQSEIQQKIQDCLNYRWKNVSGDIYQNVKAPIIERIHYIVFPTWSLNELLNEF